MLYISARIADAVYYGFEDEMLKNFFVTILFILASAWLAGCGGDDEYIPGNKTWTIMYYGDADCDLESFLMEDLAEMKAGFVNGYGVNLIVLIDRHPNSGYPYSDDSSTFGSDFSDTRLYKITQGSYERLGGGTQFPDISADGSSTYEANMGDAVTLKNFIQYCKENYPATDYALILSNHGGGTKKKSSSLSEDDAGATETVPTAKEICHDVTSNDYLYTAEISDVLTSTDSVQLFGLDACFMSSVEFAFQFRNDDSNTGFKAEIIVASAPRLWALGWDYVSIFGNLHRESVDPTYMSPSLFGELIIETQKSSTRFNSGQSLTCIDLSKVKTVKVAVELLAKSVQNKKDDMQTLRGNGTTGSVLCYFTKSSSTDWLNYPYFDLYNLAVAVNSSSSFDVTIKNNASAVMAAVDEMVLYSFGNSAYSGFVAGKSGVHIFFPDGDSTSGTTPNIHWSYQKWYNAITPSSGGYGKLAWCINGATATTDNVGNWFELLDSWYDTSNEPGGGLNGYQW